MFGQNRPRNPSDTIDGFLQVREVFYTLQGEGPFSGEAAVFVRLTGCNLRCWFCDTEWDDDADSQLSPSDIAALAAAEVPDGSKCDLVVLTGGEPLRQPLEELMEALRYMGFKRIQVETAGSFYQDCLQADDVTIVISPKTSYIHPSLTRDLRKPLHWKYVVRYGEIDQNDGLPSAPTQRRPLDGLVAGKPPARPRAGDTVYLQPCDEYDERKNSLNLIAMRDAALRFGHKAGVQLHKLVQVP